MAYISLRSGEKVWSQSARFETTIDQLTQLIASGYTHHAIEAMKTLSELGPLAIDALAALDTTLLTCYDQTHRLAILDVIDKIKPAEKKEVKKKEEKVDVEIKTGALESDAQVFKKCNFCEKETLVKKDIYLDKLCPLGRFYCRFCLRNSYNNRDNRHLLMFTMRSVFGYYFWQFHYGPPRPYMWLSEIKDYISLHEDIGLRNPVFNYDPETYTWFIDFRRVGDTKKKLPVVEVKRTVIEMLAVFNLHVHVKGIGLSSFYEKFSDAIDEFYHKRYRPEGKRLLAPTFKNCGNPEWGQINNQNQYTPPVHAGNKLSIEDTKNFSPLMLNEHLWNKTSAL